MLQINTSSLNSRKNVEIDGHPYVVRQMGAGEELTYRQLMRTLEKLAKKEETTPLTEEELIEIDEITSSIMDTMAGCFDDGGDGSRSKKLVASLSEGELTELMSQIFKQDEVKPDADKAKTSTPPTDTPAVS